MTEEKQYQKEYREFIENYKKGNTSAEDIGELITRMVQYFTEENLQYSKNLINYNIVAATIEKEIDENGKPISSAKAKIKASATGESQNLIETKAHIENLEQIINGLKSLQRALTQEMNYAGTG